MRTRCSCLGSAPVAAMLVALVVALAAAGCSGGPGPQGALDQYGAALRRKDYADAYALMSSAFRAKISRDEFVRMMRDSPREVGETAERLNGRGTVEVSAELHYGLGDSIRLVQEDGEWRLASNPLAFYEQTSPRAALRSFLRAYRLGRYDVMLRFVPERYRARMDVAKMKAQFEGPSKEAMEALIDALEASVDEPIAERGNEARMAYGERFEVKFVREEGLWMLKDLD